MSTIPDLPARDVDDLLCPDTHPTLQSPSNTATTADAPAGMSTVAQTSNAASIPVLGSTPLQSTSLTPPATVSTASKSPFYFALSDILDDASGEPLSSEITSAEIYVAPDGSFIETASGPAAREIKRRYDQHYGVGMSVRSPYAITAFVNQHGKSMFRFGHRELSAPAASAAEVEERMTQSTTPSEPSHSPRARRHSRLSMHAFLPPSMFKNGSLSSGRSPAAVSQSSGTRKLRKTRSIPDMVSLEANGNSVSSSQHMGTMLGLVGRTHSHSVTGAEVSRFSPIPAIRSNLRAGDLFGEVMDWLAPSSNASTNISTRHLFSPQQGPSNESYDHFRSPTILTQPFGPGVTFDSPSRKPAVEFLPAPRLLREMQSFESGLTARQIDPLKRSSGDSPVLPEDNSDDLEATRPPSALQLRASSPSVKHADPPLSEASGTAFSPLPETVLLSRYSTDVFNVLQTYRGLPLLEKLSSESDETTVIKMSLSADDTAAPRDDPRFVIWGEILAERDHDDYSASHDSFTDLSASVHSSSMSKKRNKTKAHEPTSLRSSAGEGTQKVLIAATIERWIAQLTSDLNYDELLDFFLTYRTYVSAVDLCHLLICRFHWALQRPTSSQDERVRRIVRVRTFVAIRFWLLTFFTVDFLPNRELRLLVANWLNTLIRDPILGKHNDGLGIVRRLIKVVKECKQAHTHSTAKPKSRTPSKPAPKQDHVLGEKFAAATQKLTMEDDDSDVDLDFLPDERSISDMPSGFPNDPANAHLTTAHVGAGLSPTRPSPIPFSSFSILQRTDHAPGPGTDDLPPVQTTAALPVHHGALSRAFVKTIGRLGRWKRVLNSRTAARTSLSACADVSAFDLELSVSRDLLTVNGGVEQYLRTLGSQASQPTQSTLIPQSTQSAQSPQSSQSLQPTQSSQSPLPPTMMTVPSAVLPPPLTVPTPSSDTEQPSMAPLGLLDTAHEYLHDDYESIADMPAPDIPTDLHSEHLAAGSKGVNVPAAPSRDSETPDRPASLRSSSTDSFGEPLGSGGPSPSFPPLPQPQWEFDVVSIDDLDFSDTSSDNHNHNAGPAFPPGLRRPQRKLPLRRDFEFVRRSDTVSSMGFASHDSIASGPSSSALSLSSATGLGGNIAQWQMNALIDSLSNDEETGDVEAALRRLEGQINPQKQQEKASKVDGWVRTIQERMAAGDYSDDQPRFSDDEDSDADLEQGSDSFDDDRDSARQLDTTVATSFISEPEKPSTQDGTPESVNTPVPSQTTHTISSGPGSPVRPPETKPAPEDVVPFEILQSRMPSRPSTASSQKPSVSRFGNPEAPQVHRSFILNYRAQILAEHFSMIDRELFMGVKFEELVLDDWMGCEEVNVLDWAQYLKDRARWKAESRYSEKTSALAAVRARFNLMANFTISEIILTQPNERPVLVAKFIRIAWKAYGMSNFSTLIAIITGLRSDWVTNAMRRSSWSRVGTWENRMFKDLKAFTTNLEDFKYIRQVVEAIVDVKPLDAGSHAASVVSGGGADAQSSKGKIPSERPLMPSACIPFIGVYLSQLQRHSKLPDLIDPTAPNEAVGFNPVTSNFDALAHPDVFSALNALPPSMHLEPLINVHKQRRIAGVIKALVAGQHLASRVQFEIDKRLFQRCLRLRGLDSDTLQRAFAMYPD